jgi:PAT family beta-lactamase induction signal transducer AmpG
VSLAEQRWLRIVTLCVLYVAQGIPWGFTATTLPGYLVEQKLDFAVITATMSFTTLPYSFKWVWGPIVDRFSSVRFGRRRPWIVFAQAMMALTIGAMIALDVSTQLKLLAWMVFIHTVFNALQDVAVDALAIDILPESERGNANGLMYASKYIGGALGGVGMAKLVAAVGLDTALIAQMIVLFAIMLVPLLVRESNKPPPPPLPSRELASALQQAFSLRSTLVAALLMLSANFAIGLVSANGYPLYINELEWKAHELAEITGGWALVAGGFFAALGGSLSDSLGRRKLVLLAAIGLSANWAVFALVPRSVWDNHTYIYVTAMIENACTAMFSVGLITMCMDLSWPRIGGSQFTAYMALSNFSTTLGYQFASTAKDWWSFREIWAFAAVWQILVIAFLLPIDPHQTRRELPYPDGAKVPRFGIGALLGLLVFLIGMTAYVTYKKLG